MDEMAAARSRPPAVAPPASGHRVDGVVIADADGVVVWCSPPLEGRVDDIQEHDVLLRAPAGTAAATVSAAPLVLEGEELVVAVVRLAGTNGSAHEAPAPATQPMRVSALGPLALEVGGRPCGGDWLQQRPGQLLKYLICRRGRPATTEAIAEDLWPNRGPAAVANVRYCMYRLRENLGERGRVAPAESIITHRRSGYLLDPARVRVDADDFEADVRAGLAALSRGERDAARAQLTAAVSRYHDDFLVDEPYAEWAIPEREYLRGLAGKALRALTRLALERGEADEATGRLERLVALEPFDVDVHRHLIALCLRRGRRTDALRHYNALRLRLARAFGESPGFRLSDLAQRSGGRAAVLRRARESAV